MLLNYASLMELGLREHTLTVREAGCLCDVFESPLLLDALEVWPQTLLLRLQHAQRLEPYSRTWDLPLSVLLMRVKRLGNLAACALQDALVRWNARTQPDPDVRASLRRIFGIPHERDDWHKRSPLGVEGSPASPTLKGQGRQGDARAGLPDGSLDLLECSVAERQERAVLDSTAPDGPVRTQQRQRAREMMRDHPEELLELLNRHNGNIAQAARELGVRPTTLTGWLHRINPLPTRPPAFPPGPTADPQALESLLERHSGNLRSANQELRILQSWIEVLEEPAARGEGRLLGCLGQGLTGLEGGSLLEWVWCFVLASLGVGFHKPIAFRV